MADRPVLCVICYDISRARQRRRTAALLEQQTVRVQDSVYEARLTQAQAITLMAQIRALIDPADSVRLYAVPNHAIARCLEFGGPSVLGAGRYWLV